MALLNRVKVAVSTAPGTGAITPGLPDTGFQSLQAAGAQVGAQYSYVIEEGLDVWELGVGTWNGTTFTRDQVAESSSGPGVKINFGSAAKFAVTALKNDFGGASIATLMKHGAI